MLVLVLVLVLLLTSSHHLFQVTHMKTRRFTLNSQYKGMAKYMRYKNPSTIHSLHYTPSVPSMKTATLAEIANVSDSLW